MRKIPFFALALTCATVHGQDNWCLNREITFLVDYAYLIRSEVRDFTLVKEERSPREKKQKKEDRELLDTEDLVECFGAESAIRAGITYHVSACASLEALYTFVLPWHATETVADEDRLERLRFPFKDERIINGFVNAKRAEAKYRSWLQNGELNYWIHVTPQYVNYFSFSYGMGFRTIFLKEKFNLLFSKNTTQASTAAKTSNGLYGVQFGTMLEINPNNCWTWSFIVKGAALVNDAKNHVSTHDKSSTLLLPNFTKSHTAAGLLIEGYAQLAYHWTSFFSMHLGYQGFLLTGVALAPEQRLLRFNRECGIRDNGQIVINGLYAGLTLSF